MHSCCTILEQLRARALVILYNAARHQLVGISLRHALPRPAAVTWSHQPGLNARNRQGVELGPTVVNVPPVSIMASACSSRNRAKPTSTGEASGDAASTIEMDEPTLPLGRGRATVDVDADGRRSVCGRGVSSSGAELGAGRDQWGGTSDDGGLTASASRGGSLARTRLPRARSDRA